MPDTWIEPELYLYHNGVAIYHCYRNNCFSGGVMENWYTTDINEQLPAFDIRDLSTYQTGTGHKAILEAAVDNGELKAPEDAYLPLTQAVDILVEFPELEEMPEILHCRIPPDVDKAELCAAFEEPIKPANLSGDVDRLTNLERAISRIEQRYHCEMQRINVYWKIEV